MNNNVAILICWLPAFIEIMNICSLINRMLLELYTCHIIGHVYNAANFAAAIQAADAFT